MGAKKRPFYRIVVADSRTARDGRFIEIVGTYDPTQDPPEITVKRDRIDYWLGTGAQPSDVARGLLKTQGFLGGVTSKSADAKKAKAAEKAAAKEAAAKAAAAEAPVEEPVTEEPAAEAPAEEPAAESAE
jgi:small subunit ribosomal protein S16